MSVVAPPRLADAVVPPEYGGRARDAVRLLVTDRRTGDNAHAAFPDLPSFVRRGDVLAVNTSATLPAALNGRRTDGSAIVLHVATHVGGALWIVEPRGAVRAGETIALPGAASATMLDAVAQPPRLWYASFALPLPMHAYLERHGAPIRYAYVTGRFPIAAYQTIFARDAGSAEMPSAARPFTHDVLNALQRAGVRIVPITLHCGVSSLEAPERPTFEPYAVPPRTASIVNDARARGSRVVAVGTTALRALESAVHGDRVVASRGWTDLVIEPDRDVRSVDGILTGFHHEGATHRSILRAFLPEAVLVEAYRAAAASGYLQHEFGDVHLIV